MAGNSTEPGQSVTSRIAAILLAFTDSDVHSLTEIARLTRLPVSTAHRLAVELAATDFLERDESGRYCVAPSLRRLGAAGWRAPTLAERGPFVLDDLSAATHRSARLGVLSGTVVNYIEKRPHQPVTSFDSAAILPAHATAVGKALLAHCQCGWFRASQSLSQLRTLKQDNRKNLPRIGGVQDELLLEGREQIQCQRRKKLTSEK